MTDHINAELIWQELRSYSHPNSDFYTTILSTIDHILPASRTVVIREINISERRLTFYTDSRSSKILQLKNNPAFQMLFYQQEKNYQLILAGKAKIIKVLEQRAVQVNIGIFIKVMPGARRFSIVITKLMPVRVVPTPLISKAANQ